MTTVSSTAQQLLAELYREELGENERSRDGGGKNIFDKYPNKWARPDSNIYEYRVESPDGTTRYYKSREGAANQLRVEYD